MKKRGLSRGFTLIELMVVLVILGMMAAFVGPKILGRPDEARVTKTKSDISSIETALKMYKLDTGVYPTTEQGLSALIKLPETEPIPKGWKPGGYLDLSAAPKDAWESEYIYRSPTDEEGRDYEIISLGADRKEGGEGINTDIKSFELK